MFILLPFFILFSLLGQFPTTATSSPKKSPNSTNSTKSPNIAVCIGGQAARWIPKHLLDGLLVSNPTFSFHLFINMQYAEHSADIVYNTDQHNAFSTNMGRMQKSQIQQYIHQLYTINHKHIHIASLQFHRFSNDTELLTLLQRTDRNFRVLHRQPKKDQENKEEEDENTMKAHTPPTEDNQHATNQKCHKLDRIGQYIDVQASILNMYLHQLRCIEQINTFEQQHQLTFDYIISTREDVYFFQPIQLASIIQYLRNDPKARKHTQNQLVPLHNLHPLNNISYPTHACDIPFKRCLNFWGLNMRFYILTRSVGMRFLGNRFAFYRFLCKMDMTVENPERFELLQANALQLVSCGLPVESIPVTAIRTYAFTADLFETELKETQGRLTWLQNGVYGTSSGNTIKSKPDPKKQAKHIIKSKPSRSLLLNSSNNKSSSSPEELKDDVFCFIWFEVDRCVPMAQHLFVKSKLCIDLRRAAYVKYLLSINATHFNKLIHFKKVNHGGGENKETLVAEEEEDVDDALYKQHVKYFNRSFDLSRLPLQEIVKRRPLTFQPQLSFAYTKELYHKIAPKEVTKVLKKKKKYHTLQRLSIDENFVNTFWTTRDYW